MHEWLRDGDGFATSHADSAGTRSTSCVKREPVERRGLRQCRRHQCAHVSITPAGRHLEKMTLVGCRGARTAHQHVRARTWTRLLLGRAFSVHRPRLADHVGDVEPEPGGLLPTSASSGALHVTATSSCLRSMWQGSSIGSWATCAKVFATTLSSSSSSRVRKHVPVLQCGLRVQLRWPTQTLVTTSTTPEAVHCGSEANVLFADASRCVQLPVGLPNPANTTELIVWDGVGHSKVRVSCSCTVPHKAGLPGGGGGGDGGNGGLGLGPGPGLGGGGRGGRGGIGAPPLVVTTVVEPSSIVTTNLARSRGAGPDPFSLNVPWPSTTPMAFSPGRTAAVASRVVNRTDWSACDHVQIPAAGPTNCPLIHVTAHCEAMTASR